MKICPKCNNQLEDSAAFCDKCGANLTVQQAPQPTYNQTQTTYSVQQPYANYGTNQQPNIYQPPVAPVAPNKKGLKWWQILLIVVAALIAVFIIIGVLGSGDNADDTTPTYTPSYSNSTSQTNSDTDDTSSSIGFDEAFYNKGHVEDGKYINKWANLQLDFPDDWIIEENQDPSEVVEGVDVGVFAGDTVTNENISIRFEKLSGFNKSITEERYLEVSKEEIKDSYASMNLTPEFSDIYDRTVAEKNYKALSITVDGMELVQKVFVRKKDDYMIIVIISAADSFTADSVGNWLTTVE